MLAKRIQLPIQKSLKKSKSRRWSKIAWRNWELRWMNILPLRNVRVSLPRMKNLNASLVSSPSSIRKPSIARNLAIGDALSDTVKVTIVINTEGNLSVKSVEASSATQELLPNLEELLKSKTTEFEPAIPAKKNQVNVTTEYVLPLVIDVK